MVDGIVLHLLAVDVCALHLILAIGMVLALYDKVFAVLKMNGGFLE